jgi:hypothetical protein
MSAALLATDSAASPRTSSSAAALWTGRNLSGIAVLFLTFDTLIKFSGAKQAVDTMTQLGWQPHALPIIGTIEAVCLILYLVPRTAPLGALLWTGYLGGAIATHLRIGNPLFGYVLFPTYVAALLWGGLYLRDARVRALFGRNR